MLHLSSLLLALLLAGEALAETTSVPVLRIVSDAWVRTGPSTSDRRVTGVARGTAVVEIAGPEAVFENRSSRWVRIFVLEGRSAGREGWVWGEFVGCCTAYEWLR
jgi:hypothetical protein